MLFTLFTYIIISILLFKAMFHALTSYDTQSKLLLFITFWDWNVVKKKVFKIKKKIRTEQSNPYKSTFTPNEVPGDWKAVGPRRVTVSYTYV